MAAIAILTPIASAYQGDIGEEVRSNIAGEALTNGLIVYDDPTTGKVKKSDATGGATAEQADGIVIGGYSVGAGQAVTVLRRGIVSGFDLSAVNFGALVYLSTAGTIDTAVNATKTVPVGKVVGNGTVLADGTIQKFLKVDFPVLSIIS